jgi:hypothetical protein
MKLSNAIKPLSAVSLGLLCVAVPVKVSAAYVQGDDNFVYAQLGTVYDSNVFRVSGLDRVPSSYHASSLSDIYTVTTVGGQYQKDLGRQQFQFGGSYNQNTYVDYSALNYKSWNTNSAFNWQLLSQLSGVLRYMDKQEQPSLNVSNQIGRDVVRTRVGGAELAWTPVTAWRFESGIEHTAMRHQVQNTLDFDQDALSLTAWYATPKGSRLGVGVEESDVIYPAMQVNNAAYEYRQTNTRLQLEWPVTAKLQLNAMLGNSAVRFRQGVQADRNHVLQDIRLIWALDQKSTLSFGYQSAPAEPGLSTADVVNKTWYLTGKSHLSDKLLLSGEVRQTKMNYSSSGVVVNTSSYRTGLQWMPWRMWQFEAYGQYIHRTSGFTDDSYDVNQVGANVKYSF